MGEEPPGTWAYSMAYQAARCGASNLASAVYMAGSTAAPVKSAPEAFTLPPGLVSGLPLMKPTR